MDFETDPDQRIQKLIHNFSFWIQKLMFNVRNQQKKSCSGSRNSRVFCQFLDPEPLPPLLGKYKGAREGASLQKYQILFLPTIV